MSEQKHFGSIVISDMTPAQIEDLLVWLPGHMPIPVFRLYHEGPDHISGNYWVSVVATHAGDPRSRRKTALLWQSEILGVKWDGVEYSTPGQEAEATRQALHNCLNALGIHRTSFLLAVKEDPTDATGSD